MFLVLMHGEAGFEKLIRAGFIRQVCSSTKRTEQELTVAFSRNPESSNCFHSAFEFRTRLRSWSINICNQLVKQPRTAVLLVPDQVVPKGASRVELSTITSEELWRKSGRLDSVASEVRPCQYAAITRADHRSYSDSPTARIRL